MTIPTEARPGAVIGYRRNGAPIRLIAGGSQMATETPAAPAAPAAEQAPPPAPAPPAAPAAPRVPPGQPEGGQFAQPGQQAQPPAQPPAPPAQPAAPETDWKAEAARLKAENEQATADVERWRRQARNQEQRSKANHQQVNQQDEVLRRIAEKVGVPYDDQPDPEVLIRQLEQERLTSRQRTIELATFTMAANTGANAAAILDSREFMQQADQLDPSAPDFSDQVRDLVKAAASQPRYQFVQPPAPAQPAQEAAVQQPAQPQQQAPPAQPPAPSSGSDFSGAPAGNGLWTQADYDAYMTTAGTNDRDGSKLNKAIAEGRLANLGVGRPRGRGRR
jgi:hypothetical protein